MDVKEVLLPGVGLRLAIVGPLLARFAGGPLPEGAGPAQ
jgi:hypothetical protein